MDAGREKLADRVLKLLALAAGSSFAAEADTARRLAEELMAKHNIAAPIDSAKNRDVMVEERYTPHFKGAIWEYILAEAVSKLCGCKAYYFGDYLLFTFAGMLPAVEACLYIVAKLHEQRVGQWLAYKRTGSDSFHKFCYGYARGVSDKIDSILPSMRQLGRDREAAQLWYEARHNVEHAGPLTGKASSNAGLDAGGGASLHRGELGAVRQRLLR